MQNRNSLPEIITTDFVFFFFNKPLKQLNFGEERIGIIDTYREEIGRATSTPLLFFSLSLLRFLLSIDYSIFDSTVLKKINQGRDNFLIGYSFLPMQSCLVKAQYSWASVRSVLSSLSSS